MNKAEEALQFVDSTERETWIRMGMALRYEFGDAAMDVWLDWSRQADSFKESDARAVWRSFHGSGISIASLFHEAKQSGWKDVGYQVPTAAQIQARRDAAIERASKEGKERIKQALAASKKAGWILHQAKPEKHAYLWSKGFPELDGLVWRPDDSENLLCIPMYKGKNLVGVQMIDRHGVKKFLSGQQSSGAEYVIDNSGIGAKDFWVEGYATGLSLRVCLAALKMRYRIHICFSAGNMLKLAHSGYCIADNDASGTGKKAAMETGLPYWMAPVEGDDLNDYWRKNGTFKTSQEIGRWLRGAREEKEYYTGVV
jgi:putative DNA primase/helicase